MTERLIIAFVLALAAFAAQAAPNQAVISFSRPTLYSDGTAVPAALPITYRVYQGVQGQPKVALTPDISVVTSTITGGLLSGTSYCWQISAIANGLESPLSNEACKTFAPAVLSPVTITVQ